MKQIMQLLMIIAAIVAIIFFVRHMNQPAGYQAVRQETTTKTKYVKEPGEEMGRHHVTTTYTKKVKPDKEGAQMTIKEETKYSTQ